MNGMGELFGDHPNDESPRDDILPPRHAMNGEANATNAMNGMGELFGDHPNDGSPRDEILPPATP